MVSINLLGLKAQMSQNLPKYYNLQMWTRIQYLRLSYNTEWQSFLTSSPSLHLSTITFYCRCMETCLDLHYTYIHCFVCFFFKDIYLNEILNFMRAGVVWFISLSVLPSEWAVAQLLTQCLSCWTEEENGGLTSSLVYVMSVSKYFLQRIKYQGSRLPFIQTHMW